MAHRFAARMQRVLEVYGEAAKRAEVGDREALQADIAMKLEIARYERQAAVLLRSCGLSGDRCDDAAEELEREVLATIEREGLQ